MNLFIKIFVICFVFVFHLKAISQSETKLRNDTTFQTVEIKKHSSTTKDTIKPNDSIPKLLKKVSIFGLEFKYDKNFIKRWFSKVKSWFPSKEDLDTLANKITSNTPKYLINVANFFKINSEDTVPKINDSAFYDLNINSLDTLKASQNPSLLEKDINSMTDVASQKSLSMRNTPGVITILTEEDLKSIGARDLIDVLQFIPGFYFALDEKGRVGLGIRGNWANEGKVLLLIDGQEMNEIFTAKLYFGNHYPVDFIKRIEIIRGPGSVIYGGFAEYGVINIITKGADDQQGLYLGITSGKSEDMSATANYSIYWGKKWKNSKLNVSYFWGNGQRTDREYYSFFIDKNVPKYGVGSFISLKNNSDIKPSFFNIAYTYKNFSIRSISDFYQVRDICSIDSTLTPPFSTGLRMNYTELKYKADFSESFSLTGKFNTIIQFEENQGNTSGEEQTLKSNFTVRPKFHLSTNWDITHRLNWIIGGEFYKDYYRQTYEKPQDTKNEFDIEYTNYSIFSQFIYRLPFINLILGGRYDYNLAYGESFVPRIALTKKYDNFNYKLLFSRAFRAPTVGNIIYAFDGSYLYQDGKITGIGKNLNPEQTTVIECEFGFKLSSNVYTSLNFFDISTTNPIVYYYYQDNILEQFTNHTSNSPSGMNLYTNFKESGSRGIEFGLKFKDFWGAIDFNYSYYTVAGKPIVSANSASTFAFNVLQRQLVDDSQLLAFPNHKLTAISTINLNKNAYLNLSTVFMGSRYGYDVLLNENNLWDVNGRLILRNSSMTFNMFLGFERFLFDGLKFSMGVYDIFNEQTDYLQPYFALITPLPNKSRELVFKFSYDFSHKFNKKTKQ